MASLAGDYDALILGTGMTQSVLSGALSRVGLSVCHLDEGEIYGGEWGTLNFRQAVEWAARGGPPAAEAPTGAAAGSEEPEEDEAKQDTDTTSVPAGRQPQTIRVRAATSRAEMMARRAQLRHPAALGRGLRPVDAEAEDEELGRHDTAHVSPVFVGYECEPRVAWRPPMPVEDMERRSYKFALDLSPRAVLCSGTLVELLVQSGVGMSTEFQTVQRLQVFADDALWGIPCSKADVFKSKLLSAMEKRLLMKLLQFCLDWGLENIGGVDVATRNEAHLAAGRSLTRPQNKSTPAIDVSGFEERPFGEFLEQRCRLKPRLRDLVIFAVAMLPRASGATTLEGLAAVYRHLSSLGRFGSSAYLFACYGLSDVVQAYCRLGAVYGATFALRMGLRTFHLDALSGRVVSVETDEGSHLSLRWLIGAPDALAAFYAPDERREARRVVRLAAVLAGPLDAEQTRTSTVFPPGSAGVGNAEPIHAHSMGEEAYVAPAGYALMYLSTTCAADADASGEAERALRAAARVLVAQSPNGGGREGVLWSMVTEQSVLRPPAALPPNVVCVSSADFAFDCEAATKEAASLFAQHWPELDLLPKSQSAQDAEAEEARADAQVLSDAASSLDAAGAGYEPSGPVASSVAGSVEAGEVGGAVEAESVQETPGEPEGEIQE